MKTKVIDFSKPHTVHGIVQMFASALPLWAHARLLYEYHFGHVLHIFTYPDRVLVLYILMSMAGIATGFLVYHQMLKTRKGYLLLLLLLVIGIVIDVAVVTGSI